MTALIGLVGAVAFLFALGAYYFTFHVGPFFYVNLAVGAASLLVWLVASLIRLSGARHDLVRTRWLRHVARGLLVLLTVIALTVYPARHRGRVDASHRQLYSLSPLTERVLDRLDEPVAAFVFEGAGEDPRLRQLVLSYAARSTKFRYRFLRMRDEPDAVGRFRLEEPGVVLKAGERTEEIRDPNEHALTNALIRLTFHDRPTLCTTIGHGEAALRGAGARAFSALARALREQRYELQPILLNGHTRVKDHCGALLILGPQRAFTAEELRDVDAYTETGGRLLVLLDPDVDSALEPLLARAGILVREGTVFDSQSSSQDEEGSGLRPMVNYFMRHAITAGFDERTLVQVETARPVGFATPPPDGWEVTALAYTSNESRVVSAATDAPGRKAPARPGWVPIAVAASRRKAAESTPDDEARIVVIGDSDFAANRNVGALYNLDFALNAIHWIAGREPLVSIGPKHVKPYQEVLTPEETLAFFYSFAMMLPEAILLTGIFIWWRRRTR